MVTEGKILQDCGIRVKRKGKVVHVGILDSLRRVKEIVKEVRLCFEYYFPFLGFIHKYIAATVAWYKYQDDWTNVP